MKKLLILFLVCILFLLSGCRGQLHLDEYRHYFCYDKLFTTLSTGSSAQTRFTSRSIKHFATYFLIPEESDNQFVGLKYTLPFSPVRWYILQNPDNYIDIWDEWTIEKITFFCLYTSRNQGLKHKQNKSALQPDRIIDSTSDAGCLSDMYAFIATDSADYIPAIHADPLETEMPDYLLYVRVSFKESKNIIWESDCCSYWSESKGQRKIYLQKSVGNFSSWVDMEIISYSLDQNSCLYIWLSDLIESNIQSDTQ